MSRPEAIRVDPASGRIEWLDGGEANEAFVDGAVDARFDEWGNRLVVLTRKNECGGVAIVSREGQVLAFMPAPEGYSLSHFAAISDPVLVGQGESPQGGWQDWHFAVDGTDQPLRKIGPAY